CISDTLVPTTYLVDTTLSNSSDSDQTVQAVRLRKYDRGRLWIPQGVLIIIHWQQTAMCVQAFRGMLSAEGCV
ncbi:hypothetical protein ACRWUG_25350, partial [Escherichia coli]